MKILNQRELKAYLAEHTESVPRMYKNFRRVTKELKVFKKVRCGNVDAIANLVIPVGELIHVSDTYAGQGYSSHNRKMRASKAFVHSIVLINTRKQVEQANSMYSSIFKYRVNLMVQPLRPFYNYPGVCESGIHFFFQIEDALKY